MSHRRGLDDFVVAWREASRKPADLFFKKTLYHDLQAVHAVASDSKKLSRAWQKRPVSELRARLDAADCETALLKAFDPQLHANLLSATTPDRNGKYDPKSVNEAVEGCLDAMKRPAFLESIREAIIVSLLSVTDYNCRNVRTLVFALLERFAEVSSVTMLQREALSAISEELLRRHLCDLREAIGSNTAFVLFGRLLESLSGALKPFASCLTSSLGASEASIAAKTAKYMSWSDRDFTGRIGLFVVPHIFTSGPIPPDASHEIAVAWLAGRDAYTQEAVKSELWLGLGHKWFRVFEEQIILAHVGHYLVRGSSPQGIQLSKEQEWMTEYSSLSNELHDLWKEYCECVAGDLLSTGLFRDWESDFKPPPKSEASATRTTPNGPVEDQSLWDYFRHHSAAEKLYGIISGGLEFGIGWACAQKCTINFNASHRDTIIRQIIESVLGEIFAYLDKLAPETRGDAREITPGLISDVSKRFSFKRRMHELAEELMKTATAHFLQAGRLLGAAGSPAFLVGEELEVVEEFRSYLLDRVLKAFEEQGLNYIDLGCVTDNDIRAALTALVGRFKEPRIYKVVGILDGINLEGKALALGAVDLYDARQWDYGEANLLDCYDFHAYRGQVDAYAPLPTTPLTYITMSSHEYKGLYGTKSGQYVRQGARAHTRVEAFDSGMAQEKADIEINALLDSINTCLTRPQESETARRIELLPEFAVIDELDGSAQLVHRKGLPHMTGGAWSRDGLEPALQAFKPLLDRSDAVRTEVERRTLLACHWLVRGYWETADADRFLNYWIALEQLFAEAGKSKLEAVLDALPKLVCTWDRTHTGQTILRAWKVLVDDIEARPELASDLDADPTYLGWRKVQTVLLSVLPSFVQTASSHGLATADQLQNMIKSTEIERQVSESNAETSYRLRLMYRRRNMIAHEGLAYCPDMGHYTQELWGMAHLAFRRIASRICHSPGIYHTVDEVADCYNDRWWRS